MRTKYYQSAQISLEILGRWINHLPFWVTETTLTAFETQQTEFKLLQQNQQTQPLSRIETLSKTLFMTVDSLLSASLNSLHPEQEELSQALRELQNNYRQRATVDEGLGMGGGAEAKTADISAALLQWIGQIQGYQDRLIKAMRLSVLKPGGAVYRRLEAKPFQRAKQIQHELFVCAQAQEDFDQLIAETKIAVPTEKQWLEMKHYTDLIFLSHLLKADAVEPALRCKQHCLDKSKQLFIHRKSTLISALGPRFHELVRWQRQIMVYAQWQRHLQTTLPNQVASLSPLLRQMTLRENVQYQKRAFFKARFYQQKAYLVINALHRQYQSLAAPRDVRQLELDLSKEKQRLQLDIANLEKQLLSGLNMAQSTLSDIAWAVSRQPAFQYGQLAARAGLHWLDQHPNVPYLGVKLPPAQVQRIEQVNGVVFLSISIGLTSWLGSSYELVSSLNNLLWMNYRVMDQLGRGIERTAHHTVTPVFNAVMQKAPQPLNRSLIRLKNVARLDEQGLAEKEAVLNWLTHLITHLGISVGLSGQSLRASIAGYSVGTACAGSAGWAVENILQHYDQDPEQIQIAKTLVYLTIYSLAYHQGYVLAHRHLGAAYDHISEAQALERLSLFKGANEQQVKKRYHQLALENHPDKCPTPACAEKMVEITEAYEVLMKKRA